MINETLKKDFYDSMINEFKSVKYNMKELPNEKKEPFNFYDVRDLFLIYVNWRKRFIGRGSRKVFYSNKLKEKLSKDKKLKKIVAKLEYKFKNYENLTPFLTKMVVNSPYKPSKSKEEFEKLSERKRKKEMLVKTDKDLLLNFFNIHHLHLEHNYSNKVTKGITFTAKEGNKRGEDLLYVRVNKDKVYFIDINKHNLYDKEILKTFQKNWEHLLEEYESEMRDITEFSEEEAWEALKNGINIPYKINNKIYFFLGISAIGTSHNEFFQSKKFFQEVQKQYTKLIRKKYDLLKKINQNENNLIRTTNIDIHIIIKEGLLFFIEKNSKTTIKFEEDNIYISPEYCEIGYHSYDFNS